MYSLLTVDKDLKVEDFSGFIRRARKSSSARAMYEGDMWDRGKGYIGPVPVNGDTHYNDILFNIKRTFTGRNVIEEVVDRAVDALLSKSPDWKIYDKTELKAGKTTVQAQQSEATLDPVEADVESSMADTQTVTNPKIAEAEMFLSEVWNRAKIGDALKDSLTNRMVSGRGMLRIYVHPKFFEKKDINDFFEMSKYIKVECVLPGAGQILDDSIDRMSVVQVSSKKDQLKMIEISFLDENDKTVVASLETNGVADESTQDVAASIKALQKHGNLSSPYSLEGELTADEMIGKPFVSETMLQNNRALNLDLSLSVGVLIESGYAEMVMTNVSMETRTETDPTDPNRKIQVPVGLKRGPGVVNNLVGEQSVNAAGETKFEQPDVYFKEPSPVKTFIDGESLYYKQILSEAKQTHILLATEADPSGESRIQARQDFVKKSQRYKPSLDVHGSWALNTILNLAASALNKDGYFSELGVLFDCKVYAGELSADEQNVIISRYEKNLISRETAITLLGSEEPLLEIDKIKKDEMDSLALQVKRLEATAKFGKMIANGAPSTSGQDTQGGNTVAGTAGAAGDGA
jgi:hypothetical protein